MLRLYFENPEGGKNSERNGTKFHWCKNDCHLKPIWWVQNLCLSKKEFQSKIQERQDKGKEEKKFQPINNLKAALSVDLLGDDYKAIEEQILNRLQEK
eukprot:14849153-Ditylum_brightwellii.AAC.1